MSKLKLPTIKHIVESTEANGTSYYVYMAVYDRDGKQWGAMHGCAGKPFARRVANLLYADHDVRRAEKPTKKKARKR